MMSVPDQQLSEYKPHQIHTKGIHSDQSLKSCYNSQFRLLYHWTSPIDRRAIPVQTFKNIHNMTIAGHFNSVMYCHSSLALL